MSMTNMKALPMLDHVMLWILRVVAILFLVQAIAQTYYLFRPTIPRPFMTPLWVASHVEFAALLFVCSWLVSSRILRWILGGTGIFRLIMLIISVVRFPQAYFFLDLAHLNPHYWYLPLDMLILPLLWLTSDLAMIWVAFRPPRNSDHSATLSENHPIPQSC
jgi:hypothetical protein